MLNEVVIGIDGVMAVVDELDRAGFEVWMPTIRDGVVGTRRYQPGDRLPVGYVSVQSPGRYELVSAPERSRFGWAVGPQPWKPLLHPSSTTTMSMTSPGAGTVAVSVRTRRERPLALFGMRPCDLAGVDALDTVLLDSAATGEPTYRNQRGDAFLVVVNCGVPAATCFCVSAGTGPHVDGRRATHDIEITELVDAGPETEPEYVVTAISARGALLLDDALADVNTRSPTVADDARTTANRDTAVDHMQIELDPDSARWALADAHGSTRWDDAAAACLACGSCTSVCPTCFCTTTTDVGDLAATSVERRREWESCFSLEFSRLGDSPARSSTGSRYRQWMTHKLSTWHDQFGDSGCVGCGRCTTWCPAGIDFVAVASGFVVDSRSEPT